MIQYAIFGISSQVLYHIDVTTYPYNPSVIPPSISSPTHCFAVAIRLCPSAAPAATTGSGSATRP